MRSMLPPVEVPIYVAALGPRNLELTGELADGWIGNAFLPEHADAFLEPLRAGAARAGRSLADLDLVMPVAVEFTDDVEEAARRHARGLRLHDRGDGLAGQELLQRRLRPPGLRRRRRRRAGAVARRQARARPPTRVPLELGLKTNLLGTPAMVKDRLRLLPRRRHHHAAGQAQWRSPAPTRHPRPARRARRRGQRRTRCGAAASRLY